MHSHYLKTAVVLLFALFIVNGIHAGGWTWLNSKPQADLLSQVKFANSNTGYAVSWGGNILKTVDGGQTWLVLSPGVVLRFNSIFCVDACIVYAVGFEGTIVKTTDGGDHWTLQNTSEGKELTSVWFTNCSTGFAVGLTRPEDGYSVVYKTTNGGNTWNLRNTGMTFQFFSVCFIDSLTGYLSGKDPLSGYAAVLKTTNSGNTWTAVPLGAVNFFNDISFPSRDTGYVVGNEGFMRRTVDGGNTWSSLNSGYTGRLHATFFTDRNTGYAAGDAGTVLKTTDAGDHWSSLNSGTQYDLYSAFFVSADTGYITGDFGLILHTRDGGVTWTNLSYGSTARYLSSPFFLNTDSGFVVGSKGTILKTTDGGTNWTDHTISTLFDLYAVHFPSALTGYAVGFSGLLAMTKDAGETWTSSSIGGVPLRSVFFTSNDTGFVAGNGKLYKTRNGGVSWTTVWTGTKSLNTIFFTSKLTGYAGGASATLLKTTDGGNTWFNLNPSAMAWNSINSIWFTDDNTGYCAGTYGRIIKTTDGGFTWQEQVAGLAYMMSSIQFPTRDTGYAIANNPELNYYMNQAAIFRTTNGGADWVMTPMETMQQVYSLFFTSANVGYIAGSSGLILKTTTGGIPFLAINGQPESQTVCDGDSAVFSVAATGTGLSYQWRKGMAPLVNGGAVSGATSSRMVLFPVKVSDMSADYNVLVRAAGMSPIPSSNASLIVHPIPAVPVVSADTYFLTSSAASGNQWYHDGVPISGATGHTYVVPVNATGHYWTMVTIEGCQSDPSNHVYVHGLGLNDPEFDGIHVFPNPCDNHFSIRLDCRRASRLSLEMYDILGKKVYAGDFYMQSGENTISVHPGNLQSAFYSIILRSGRSYVAEKIMIRNPQSAPEK